MRTLTVRSANELKYPWAMWFLVKPLFWRNGFNQKFSFYFYHLWASLSCISSFFFRCDCVFLSLNKLWTIKDVSPYGLSEFFKYIKYFLLQESHYRQKEFKFVSSYNSLNRKIIHIDMDAFMLLWSKWTTYIARKAVAVGGSENRGCCWRAMRLGNLEFDLRLVALWPRSTARDYFC
jgi:hypothetical protein